MCCVGAVCLTVLCWPFVSYCVASLGVSAVIKVKQNHKPHENERGYKFYSYGGVKYRGGVRRGRERGVNRRSRKG